jgi:hypothetical protein
MPLVAAALGCSPGGSAPLEAGLDETGGDDGSGGSGSESGDGTDDGGVSDNVAPQLLSAWTDETGKYIVLRFSEPMAPPDGVDPSDFRISHAMTLTIYNEYYSFQASYSHYDDPHYFFHNQQYGSSIGDGPTSVITSVTAGELATTHEAWSTRSAAPRAKRLRRSERIGSFSTMST